MGHPAANFPDCLQSEASHLEADLEMTEPQHKDNKPGSGSSALQTVSQGFFRCKFALKSLLCIYVPSRISYLYGRTIDAPPRRAHLGPR